MANVDIRVGKKNASFFSANPTLILKDGQFIFNSDTSELFIGDGTTQLSSLVAINGASYTLTASEIGSVINATTSATPNDTDLVISVDSSVAKKNTWTQIKTFLKTYFDTIYTTTSAVATQITTALSGYVNTSGLTTNYIPKAIDSDTLGNSIMTENLGNIDIDGGLSIDDLFTLKHNSLEKGYLTYDTFQVSLDNNRNTKTGVFDNPNKTFARISSVVASNDSYISFWTSSINNSVGSEKIRITKNGDLGVGTLAPIARIHGVGSDSTSSNNCALFVNSSNAEILKLRNDRAIIIDSLTASQILELDANKVVISVAKNSGYNLALGTTPGTVLEGNRITQTITNGVTDKAPSEDAVFDALAAKKDTQNILMVLAVITPADSTTYYGGVSLVPTTTASNHAFRLPYGGRVIGASIICRGGTAGSAEDSTINFRNITQASSTLISNAVKTNATSTQSTLNVASGLDISFLSTDEFCIEWITPAYATNPTSQAFSIFLQIEKA
jgi:hypothetical protein